MGSGALNLKLLSVAGLLVGGRFSFAGEENLYAVAVAFVSLATVGKMVLFAAELALKVIPELALLLMVDILD